MINLFRKLLAKSCDYTMIANNLGFSGNVYPLLRDINGGEGLYSVSPEHGRSYVVGKTEEGRYIITKGNGLSYTQWIFLNTKEMGTNSWGLVLKEDALRDFNNGKLAASYGIKTNRMQCVFELGDTITIADTDNNKCTTLKPVLLQYDVECPLRISDAAFYPKEIIKQYAQKWRIEYVDNSSPLYMIAANVLINNLRVMHNNNFLHNAITVHNYTWALELLDFEMSNSEKYPYNDEVNSEVIQVLYNRELLHTYQVITYIAVVLGETVDFKELDNLFEKKGFSLQRFSAM